MRTVGVMPLNLMLTCHNYGARVVMAAAKDTITSETLGLAMQSLANFALMILRHQSKQKHLKARQGKATQSTTNQLRRKPAMPTLLQSRQSKHSRASQCNAKSCNASKARKAKQTTQSTTSKGQ